jgi:hypothetical protein
MRLPLTIKPYGVASNLPPDSQIAPESHLIGGCKYFSQYASTIPARFLAQRRVNLIPDALPIEPNAALDVL